MLYKRAGVTALFLSAALTLSACGSASAVRQTAEGSAAQSSNIQVVSALPDAVPVDAAPSETASISTDAFSNRDLAGTWDASSAVAISLNGSSITASSDAVKVSGSTATITAAGTYLLSGTLENGSIIVDVGKEEKVQLVLNGASIHSNTFAAIYVRQADKVFLTLADGTVNTLSNGGTFETIDENKVDGAVFSKDDLTLNGTGKLVVASPGKHGVVCKDDLVVTGGSYEITALGHALTGKDSVSVAGGTFALTAGKDGIHAENGDDTEKGTVYIADGALNIAADGDGVSASGTLQIDGGAFGIKAGGGSQNSRANTDESRKGLKADGNLILNGGTYAIDAADDGIHSNASIEIASGEYAIKVGDDGIHADELVQIDGGTFDINAYEGIEGTYIRFNDGIINIYASDDGVNAARKSSAYTPTIEINGGTLTVEVGAGDTDCIDSNGNLIITGGTVNVTGRSTFDIDGNVTFTGGTVIANGEQIDTIPRQTMGGRGGMGGMGRNQMPSDGTDGGTWRGRGGNRVPTDGETADGSQLPGGRGGKRFPMENGTTDGTTTPDNGSGIPGGKSGKGQRSDKKQSAPADTVTAPTQNITPI